MVHRPQDRIVVVRPLGHVRKGILLGAGPDRLDLHLLGKRPACVYHVLAVGADRTVRGLDDLGVPDGDAAVEIADGAFLAPGRDIGVVDDQADPVDVSYGGNAPEALGNQIDILDRQRVGDDVVPVVHVQSRIAQARVAADEGQLAGAGNRRRAARGDDRRNAVPAAKDAVLLHLDDQSPDAEVLDSPLFGGMVAADGQRLFPVEGEHAVAEDVGAVVCGHRCAVDLQRIFDVPCPVGVDGRVLQIDRLQRDLLAALRLREPALERESRALRLGEVLLAVEPAVCGGLPAAWGDGAAGGVEDDRIDRRGALALAQDRHRLAHDLMPGEADHGVDRGALPALRDLQGPARLALDQRSVLEPLIGQVAAVARQQERLVRLAHGVDVHRELPGLGGAAVLRELDRRIGRGVRFLPVSVERRILAQLRADVHAGPAAGLRPPAVKIVAHAPGDGQVVDLAAAVGVAGAVFHMPAVGIEGDLTDAGEPLVQGADRHVVGRHVKLHRIVLVEAGRI